MTMNLKKNRTTKSKVIMGSIREGWGKRMDTEAVQKGRNM